MPGPGEYYDPIAGEDTDLLHPPATFVSVLDDPAEEKLRQFSAHTDDQRFNFAQDKCNDRFFAIAFFVHLVLFALACTHFGTRFATEGGFDVPYSKTTFNPSARIVFGLLAVAACSAGLFAFVWVEAIKSFPKRIMHVSFTFFVVTIVAFAAYSLLFLTVTWFHGVLLTAMALVAVISYFANRRGFPFAEAILQAAGEALSAHSSPVVISLMLALLQVGWVLLWGFCAVAVLATYGVVAVGGMDPDAQRLSSGLGLAVGLLVLSFFWTWQVIGNVGHTATAGTVAAWWLQPGYTRDNIARRSLTRATTTAFGSICLGSLLVAVVQSLRSVIRFFVKEDETSFFQLGLNCLLVCVESALEYFNRYAFTFVAVYGDGFVEAGSRTTELFAQRGFTAMINDDLAEMPLQFGAASAGLVAALVTAACALVSVPGYSISAIALCAFCVGFGVASVAFGVVRSAVATTFVVWAELPAELEQVQPEAFRRITAAHRDYYGGECV